MSSHHQQTGGMSTSSTSSSSSRNIENLSVLTPEFFRLYDELWQAASSSEAAQVMLRDVSKERDETHGKLKELLHKLDTNRHFAMEQIQRIELVSTHWFYGTTLLQPQLWLRGGCQGKIARARTKLSKCDAEYPTLLRGKQQIENSSLPRLNRSVQQAQEFVSTSSTAVTTRDAMRAKAIREYPSNELKGLQHQHTTLQKEIETYKTQVEQLSTVSKSFNQAQERYNQARTLFEQADQHRRRHRQLLNEPLPSLIDPPPVMYPSDPIRYWGESNGSVHIEDGHLGSKIVTLHNSHRSGSRHTKRSVAIPKVVLRYDPNGRLTSTNIPCPNDCGFLVGVSHGTHCCQICFSQSNKHGGRRGAKGNNNRPQGTSQLHGPRCQREALSSQNGAKELLTSIKRHQDDHMKSIQGELENAKTKFRQGQEQVKQGREMVEKAIAAVPIVIQERFNSVWTATFTCVADHSNNRGVNKAGGSRGGGGSLLLQALLALSSVNINVHVDESNSRGNRSDGGGFNHQVSKALDTVEQCQFQLTRQDSTIQQFIDHVRDDITVVEQNILIVLDGIKTEQETIWNNLRSRALFPSGSATVTGNASVSATAPVTPTVAYEPSRQTSGVSTPHTVQPSAPLEDETTGQNHTSEDVPYCLPPAYAPHHASNANAHREGGYDSFSATSSLTESTATMVVEESSPDISRNDANNPSDDGNIPMVHAVLID